MIRTAIGRRISLFVVSHPDVLEAYLKHAPRIPFLPRGYRRIMKK